MKPFNGSGVPISPKEPNPTKDKWIQDRKEEMRLTNLEEIAEILSTTIKHDEVNKKIVFLSMLLNYTKDNQVNIWMEGESSKGKSYIPLEVAKFFPKEDLMILGYTSKRAFFHDYGEWVWENPEEKTKGYKVIDLKGKIIIWLDQPSNELLQVLRPLLSHDRKRILHKITDKNKKGKHRTENIIIEGYPTVIFCTAKVSLDDQEKTRAFLLSPEDTQEKLKETIGLLSERLANPEKFEEEMREHPQRKWLKNRVQIIKSADIQNVIIPEEAKTTLYSNFIFDRKNLTPRHQRDFPRVLALVKAHALLNCYQRERIENPERSVIANMTDGMEGSKLYNEIAECNELGLDPEIWKIWKKIIEPNITKEKIIDIKHTLTGENAIKRTGITYEETFREYYKKFGRHIGNIRLKRTVYPSLESAGLVYKERNPANKSQVIFYKVDEGNGEKHMTPEGGAPLFYDKAPPP